MDGYSIFVVLLAGYIALLVAVGYFYNKRQTSLREFLLAGRRAGPVALGFSAAASWLTAGAMLAVVGFFMLLGMGSIWGFVAPNILALLIIALLVRKIRSIPAMTQPELLEIRYGSFLRLPVALIIIVVMVLFAVADIKGFAMVLQIFYGISKTHAALIVGLSVAVYVTLGGLSAVIATDTIQFVLLCGFVLIMSVLVLGNAGEVSGLSLGQMIGSMDGSWWNPMAIGLPMVLIFTVAIIPGWISEQDPWQKIWAARDVKSARAGMVLGSLLVAVVFGGCAFIALGLQHIYPDIAGMGFPMGMAKAEPALLSFIMGQGYPAVTTALCAVALAAAAMSCADTFAASGASCIARDIYQRYLNPGASMRQMLMANRLGVLCIVASATIGSFYIDSIIEAIHIATFIASASYFFPLMGGMYWKRGTATGAAASMIIGFVSQCILIIIDLNLTQSGGPPFLESLYPVLMGHGVIVAMVVSGLVYVAVSLATAPVAIGRLAPFFPDQARLLATSLPMVDTALPELAPGAIVEMVEGDRVYLRMNLELPANLAWRDIVSLMSLTKSHWLALGGEGSIRRCTRADIFSCVCLLRGDAQTNGWLEAEGACSALQELKNEVAMAYHEVVAVIGAVPAAEPAPAVVKNR